MASVRFNGKEIQPAFYDGGNVTAAQLLIELGTTVRAFNWYITKKGCIRASLNNDVQHRVFDPITAVAYSKVGVFFPVGEWTKAAATMGLEYSDCADLIAAFNYDWDPSCRQGALRRHLLGALGHDASSVPASTEWHRLSSVPH